MGAKKFYIHNEEERKLMYTYKDMVARCNTKTHKLYKHYGGRGIKVCEEWQNDYRTFFEWALNNGFDLATYGRGKLTLDRIDVNGNYAPDNCRFANQHIQNANKVKKYALVGIIKRGKRYSGYAKVDGITRFACSSLDLNECIRLRNEFIIKNNSYSQLNKEGDYSDADIGGY